MKIEIFPPLSIHEIGQRDNQEDAIAQWDNRLFVLCDGMGGHEKGEVASQAVCQSLVTWFQENVKDDSFTDDQLHEALVYAYTELDKFDDDSTRKMGTTLTLLYIHSQGVTAAHMGDSRIYHIRLNSSPIGGGREGAVFYQSRDHSLVFDLFQAGEITYEEMATFPQKNVITRVLMPGQENRMRPDVVQITDIQPGDYFYMCSDGMLEQMSNDELVAILSSELSDEEKRQQLIATSTDNQDNHSAWIIHVKDVILEEGDEQLVNEEPTARCNAINILPKRNIDKNDVESAENVIERAEEVVETVDEAAKNVDDDVVVVSTPAIPKKKKNLPPSIKWIIAAILLVILVAACFVLFGGDGKENDEKNQIEQMKSSYNDEILNDSIKDLNRDINNGSAKY